MSAAVTAVAVGASAPIVAAPPPVCHECGARHPETVACDPWAPLAESELACFAIIADGDEDAAL